jgi:plastocyanin
MPSFRQCASWILVGLVLGCGGGGGGTPPGPTPSVVAKTGGDNQVGAAGTPLSTPLEVTVKDGSGNPLAGISVSFAAATGGGSVAPTSASSGADGKATTTRTLGPGAGTQTTTATVTGVTPASFSSIATIQGAVTIAASGAATRSDTVKATATPALAVVVKDQNGAAVSGVTVNWSVSGHGQLSQTATTTDVSGLASVTWTFDSIAGTQTAQAAVTGLVGSPIVFTGTASGGHAVSIASAGGDNQTGTTGLALANPLQVKVADQFGNGTAGVTVAWQSTSDSASVAPTSSMSDATGIAQTVVTLGDTAGPVTITATNAALTGSPVTFHATAQKPPPIPTTAAVDVGDDFFKSVRNMSQNPAVDTVAVGGKVTWTWRGAIGHSVQSLGPPSFTSSVVQTSGTYSFTFTAAGTYNYDCSVHGLAMTGKIVVR